MQEQENVISVDWKRALMTTLQLGIFISLTIMAPFFGNQFLTGSIVNALLFISATIMGVEYAILLCLIPSLVSIYTGFLPFILAPFIPFIMIGNILLVLVYSFLKQKGFWIGAIFASFVKFIFIGVSGLIMTNSILSGVTKNVVTIISWPQLATAISGACIAYLFLKIVRRDIIK